MINGTAVTPPFPVLVPSPAAVRRNHSSTVKVDERRPGEAPIVTYWFVPLSCRPLVVGNGIPIPGDHVAVGVIVPLFSVEFPAPSAAVVPEVAFRCHRPKRPFVGPISVFMLAWISLCERAVLQMRASSIWPAKKPSATPVLVSADPMAVADVTAAFAGWPTTRDPSGAPSR